MTFRHQAWIGFYIALAWLIVLIIYLFWSQARERKQPVRRVLAFICHPCAAGKHGECKSGKYCDCQHRVRPAAPPPEDETSAV